MLSVNCTYRAEPCPVCAMHASWTYSKTQLILWTVQLNGRWQCALLGHHSIADEIDMTKLFNELCSMKEWTTGDNLMLIWCSCYLFAQSPSQWSDSSSNNTASATKNLSFAHAFASWAGHGMGRCHHKKSTRFSSTTLTTCDWSPPCSHDIIAKEQNVPNFLWWRTCPFQDLLRGNPSSCIQDHCRKAWSWGINCPAGSAAGEVSWCCAFSVTTLPEQRPDRCSSYSINYCGRVM